MVKYFAQGHEYHQRDSNPHSADQKHQSLSPVLLPNSENLSEKRFNLASQLCKNRLLIGTLSAYYFLQGTW